MNAAKKMPFQDEENGLHPEMTREAYDALDRVNYSTLKLMGKSPEHYLWRKMHKQDGSDVLDLGIATHLAVFEPEKFTHEVEAWDGKQRRGEAWETFQADNAGKLILPQSAYFKALAIAKSVRSHRVAASHLEGGPAEVTVLWTHKAEAIGALPGYSMHMRGRLDFITPTAIVDLKTTRDASPEAFGRSAWNFRYHTQAAMYQDGYFAATGKRLPYVLVAVESEEPFSAAVYTVPDRLIRLGRDEYRGWLDRLNACRIESRWPGYFDGEMELELPRWAAPEDDSDLSETGITFSKE